MKDDDGLRFECTQCGHCCHVRGTYAHVYLDDFEVARLAHYLGLTVGAFKRTYTFEDELGWTQLRFESDHCPLLDPQTNRCTVHAARPTQCRTYPFWREFVVDGRWTDAVRDACEGIGRGRVHDPDEVEALMIEQERAEDS